MWKRIMRHSMNHISTRKSLPFVVAFLVVTTSLTLTLKVSSLSSSDKLQSATLTSTYNYPVSWQTQDAKEQETRQAGTLTPYPTGTLWIFPPSTLTPAATTPYPSTPAGNGVILDPRAS